MDAVKFIKERNRMCGTMSELWGVDAAQIVKNTEEWSAAHPRKTRQNVFLEQWPEATLDRHGISVICPKHLNYIFSCIDENDTATPKRYKDCTACRREFWMQEVE